MAQANAQNNTVRAAAVYDVCRPIALPVAYPAYILGCAKLGLLKHDGESIIADVSRMEPVGDCRHAITVKDTDGNSYRVTIKLERGQ